MTAGTTKSLGLIDALLASFNVALRTPEGIAEPVAILWTDADGEWRSVIPALRAAVPQAYALGPYDPEKSTGPAIWLKCIVERSLPEVSPKTGVVPILYLPGVSRQELRAAGDCRPSLQPLIELQFRGRVWHQQNGRDWSVEAFLVSADGLGLDIAQDARTREAILRSLPLLAEADINGLHGRRLEADDFDKLAISDPVRDLLRWMSSPELFQNALDASGWESFCSVALSEFGIDPDRDGLSTTANALITGGGKWDAVWRRFTEAPKLYPGIPELLRSPLSGQGNLAFDESRSPTRNDDAESRLRSELVRASSMPHRDACDLVASLEAEHGRRRDWVWAQLGESPMAQTLEHLARLAKLAKLPLGGDSVESMASTYAREGWLCDRAAMQALANVKAAAERALIRKVVRALYETWLNESTRHFQQLVAGAGDEVRKLARGVTAEKDSCILFVDGLRFDVAGMLMEKLEARSFQLHASHRFSPLPTVTATAKPISSPAFDAVEGSNTALDFMPVIISSKQPATADRLRAEIAKCEVEVFGGDEFQFASGAAGGGWTEIGRIDELGHKLGAGLAAQLGDAVDVIADHTAALLEGGWRRVRVVTDHGWLLLPGGLPKFDLPAFLVETKWARCAVVRGNSTPDVPTYSWYFNSQVRIASPPGVACFGAGKEYAHGGVSLQECVVPELIVERGVEAVTASIVSVQWRGMRCRVEAHSNDPAVQVDLRLNWKQPATSIVAAIKPIGAAGEVSLAVTDDKHEGAGAMVVLLDSSGKVLDQRSTVVGETR